MASIRQSPLLAADSGAPLLRVLGTMPGLTSLPPFPEDIPTHPLLVVDYDLVRSGDQGEIDKLWYAATHLGFW